MVLDTTVMNVSISEVVDGPRHDGAAGSARDHGLRAGDGGVHDDRREARGQVRAQADLRDRARGLRGRFADHRAEPQRRGAPGRLVVRRGDRRRPGDPRDRLPDGRELLGPGAGDGLWPARRNRGRGRGGRAVDRRFHHHRVDLAARVRRRDDHRDRHPALRPAEDPARARRERPRRSTSSGRRCRRPAWGWSSSGSSSPASGGWSSRPARSRSAGEEITPFGFSVVPFLIVGGLVFLGMFLRWEDRVARAGRPPLLRPELLKVPQLRGGLAMFVSGYLLMAGTFFVLPLYLQLVLGMDTLETGIKILPISIAMMIAAVVGARLADRRLASNDRASRAVSCSSWASSAPCPRSRPRSTRACSRPRWPSSGRAWASWCPSSGTS